MSQTKLSADSLARLSDIVETERDPDLQLTYSNLLIEAASEVDSVNMVFWGYLYKGRALQLKGDLVKALDNYFQGSEIALNNGMKRESGLINVSIGDIYSIQGDHKNAVNYYKTGIEILLEENDSSDLASAELNLGDEYLNQNMPDSALYYFRRSQLIYDKIKFDEGTAYTLGNMGMAYAQMGKDDSAKFLINEAIEKLELIEDYYPVSVFLTYMADIYVNQGNWETGLAYGERSLELAIKYGLKDQISEANFKMSQLHEALGNFSESLRYYKVYDQYKDSVNNVDKVQAMANLRSDYEIAQKQTEVNLLEQQSQNDRLVIIATASTTALLAMLAIGLFRRYRFINRTKSIIEQEKNRSDHLLLNILPEETAEELKEFGKVKAKQYPSVSVMFADFQGFTKVSEYLTPEEVVRSVDYYFSKFDLIMEKYDLEKIKTMGDAYMCAGGLQQDDDDHATRMVQAGFEIISFVQETFRNKDSTIAHFEVRVGINTGPVIAGVVGTKKFAYDIWGDTVNIAARMESNSQPGRINVSEYTYQQIKKKFSCEYRGEINVKNKGMMKMYFIENPEISESETSDYQEDKENTTISR